MVRPTAPAAANRDIFSEMQQRPEWRYVGSVFGDPDLAVINRDAVDAVWRAFVGETGARDQLIRSGQVAQDRRP
jgi:hypothetical protein